VEFRTGHYRIWKEAAMGSPTDRTFEQRRRERAEITFVLLLVQAAIAMVSALGALILIVVAGGPAFAAIGLLTVAWPVLLVLFAAGILRGRRWARRGALIYEGITLAAVFINMVLGLLPQVQIEMGLIGFLTTLCLPAAVIGLLVSPGAQPVPARRSVPKRTTQTFAPVATAWQPLPSQWTNTTAAAWTGAGGVPIRHVKPWMAASGAAAGHDQAGNGPGREAPLQANPAHRIPQSAVERA
jgi:hypothetical protein